VKRRSKDAGALLHFDCFSGAAGNMLLGALLDAGARAKAVREELARLDVAGLRMRVSRVKRGALVGSYVRFSGPARAPAQRRWREIRKLLSRAPLSGRVRERSLAAFGLLAEAEARVHGVPADRVHFHEVGAIDAIGDIVGVCAAVEDLAPARITASALPLGHGSVETAHGRLPLPAPATLELLRGVPTYPLDVAWETVTPTGAALLRALVEEFGPLPAMLPERQGYGAGDDRQGPAPNLLRAIVGRVGALGRDTVTLIETHLDDTPPEQLPYLIDRLMEEGALDAALIPLSMKKGRPGQLLRVMARPADRERLARRVLLESSALGVRTQEWPRLVLERRVTRVETRFGKIRVKLATDPDGRTTAAAEHDDCARAARRAGVPLREVYREAEREALEQE